MKNRKKLETMMAAADGVCQRGSQCNDYSLTPASRPPLLKPLLFHSTLRIYELVLACRLEACMLVTKSVPVCVFIFGSPSATIHPARYFHP